MADLPQCVVTYLVHGSPGTSMPELKVGLRVVSVAKPGASAEPVPGHAEYWNDSSGIITIPLPRLSNVTLKSVKRDGKEVIDQFASAVIIGIPDTATADLQDLLDDPVLVVTGLAPTIHAATSKVTPVNADEIPIADSAASFGLKKLTWANLKATLKAYFDTLYAAIGAAAAWGGITGTLSAQTDLDNALTAAKARANHTGTQSADTLTDGTTNKAFLATERTKLSGIATGATANSSDGTLLARANHTGTQDVATVSGLGTLATQSGTFSGTSSGTNTGDQVLPTRASLSVDNTNNTSDANKPISTATQTALNLKADGLAGVKVYRALLLMVAASDPTATVLENSLAAAVVWTRDAGGSYFGTLAGAFLAGKVFCSVTIGEPTSPSVGIIPSFNRMSDNAVWLKTFDITGSAVDGESASATALWSVEILTYP